mmetsp:Transcript_10613/g.18634  ORF Transcript_10613/g.18634 Transcript_10613/m.18634 type:complete len:574 (+) Transcript_10613:124-1845(+)|eukprot:CAMPEP_0183734294 /NCGR_PEP_ID=MMETSP0737-20130205/43391_1 /TAXON_ID=385413 /ORGANISM="Thalassiosira miniscula, Strain CCMP1093" /LENGTH=573 /DNA_ID=CAMNT_0025967751 /DNA_START=91 /DNA_END=1812 /DNA_ORIENTATION=-
MANSYGFDFLRAEHNFGPSSSSGGISASTSSGGGRTTPSYPQQKQQLQSSIPDASHKSALEKQADVLLFLRHHRSSGCLPPSVIYKSLGIDLSDGGKDADVVKMLLNNAKVNVEEVPDPENPSLSMNLFGYRAKFSTVRDKATLLAQINRMKNGVKWSDLTDAYDHVEKDLQKLLTGGEILGVWNNEEKDKILFPRGESFLVELDGCVTLELPKMPPEPTNKNDPMQIAVYKGKCARIMQARKLHSCIIQTDVEPRLQIRRGEAVRVGGEWFRVSSAVREDLPLDKQPPRAQAPPSVVSMKDLSKKNEVDGYVRRFDSKTLPLDGPLSENGGVANLSKAKEARERLHAIAGGEGGGAGGTGAGMRGVTGGASATLLSSFASEKNPSMLAGVFAKSVAASFGMGRAGGGIVVGGRKRPTARINARRPGDGGAGGPQTKGNRALDAEAVKTAVEDARVAALNPALAHSHAIRHGCTKDVRDMYLETLDSIPTSEVDLHKMLLEHKLIEPGEKMSRPRMKRKANVDNDGKTKKRRYYERKNMRRTNTHLDGTDIGAMLALAAEKQSQGKAVGDGGM